MGTGSVLYRIVLLLHIAAAIVGFGGLIATALTNAKAFHSRAVEARTLLQGGQAVSKIASYAIYALLALGIVLIAISDDAFGFGDGWVSASFVVWFAAVGVFHGVVRPAVSALVDRAEALAAAGGTAPLLDGDAEATGLARRLGAGEGVVQILLIISLALMIWKPGA